MLLDFGHDLARGPHTGLRYAAMQTAADQLTNPGAPQPSVTHEPAPLGDGERNLAHVLGRQAMNLVYR